MGLAMPVVWSDRHRAARPRAARSGSACARPAPSCPARAERIRAALAGGGRPPRRGREPAAGGPARASTTARCSPTWPRAWEAVAGGRADRRPGPGPGRALRLPPPRAARRPSTGCPTRRRRRPGRALRLRHDDPDRPGHLGGRAGAADAALTAADLVAGRRARRLRLLPPARPPRDPRAPSAAPATSTTPPRRPRGCAMPGRGPVAVIDIDAHHGNGTQSIFYEDPRVLTGSVHVDPGAGWFPHFLGFAGRDRRRRGRGRQPQPAAGARAPATGRGWRRSPSSPPGRESGGARALVVALGRRRRRRRPREPARGQRRRLPRARAARSAALGLPTVVVQEGGYDLGDDRRAGRGGAPRPGAGPQLTPDA